METMPSDKVSMKTSENRRSTKPVMERRRRARINESLGELKKLILDALKKDNARHSKLEKADILEMTVKHLQNIQRQQTATRTLSDPLVMSKFRAGFNECAKEVTRYFSKIDGVDLPVRQRLVSHLADCLSSLSTQPCSSLSSTHPGGVQVPTNTNNVLNTVHLLPTRLPSGEIAFILPGENETSHQHLNMLPTYPPATTFLPPSPVSVLGSSGILSPAASDRTESSPSPINGILTATPLNTCKSISPIPSYHQLEKQENERVWRPW
ncbi:transcription factor HES-4-A-like [Limulus polyphemus]|uniref:Transcription factor HES-4-A-like n=1 Tax=Limulus polyphemus TaxID=6850 RepID=A0ABM1C2N3_LIMPO|nr:transcription factor HES-4-A-like [Limulus polyphemus]